MSEAAATELAPEPAPTTDALLMEAIGEVKACRAAIEADIARHGERLELITGWHRLAELQDQLKQVAMFRSLAEIEAAAEPEAETEPAAGRHRAPRQRAAGQQRALKAVRSVGPVGGFVAAFRHSWAAHPVATAATGFTAATLATAAVVAPATGVVHPFGAGTSGTPAPAASVVAATPMLQPVTSSSPRMVSELTHPKADTASSAPLTLPTPVSPVQGPGDPQGQDVPSSQGQGPAPQVHLVVTSSLDLGSGSSGTIRITAFGGTLDWSAATSAGGLVLDSSSGTLGPGHTATIGVSITADLQALTGPGSVTITYGDKQSATVPVSWAVVPLPVPDPVTSDTPVDLPSLPPVLGS